MSLGVDKIMDNSKTMKIELSPNPYCKECYGRGYLWYVDDNYNANKLRVVRLCHCLKAVVDISKGIPKEVKIIVRG